MPVVPTEFVPRVGASEMNAPPVQAPAVEPMQNATPGTISGLGAAMTQAGQTALTIGQTVGMKIQNEIDDAKVKSAETQFIQSASDAQNNYLNTSNADALAGFAPTQEAIIKAKQTALSGLDNDLQKRIFSRVADQHLVSFGSTISQHQAQQRKQYGISESASRADSMRTMAQNVDVGSKDQDAYIETGVAEARSVMAAKGFPADSEETKKAERDYRTQIVGDNVSRLMVAGQYDDAKTLLGEQMTAGNVDPDIADRLHASIESNVKRVETDNKADSIFAEGKGSLQISDLDAMLKKADEIADPDTRKDVRSLVVSQFSQASSMQQKRYEENLDSSFNTFIASGYKRSSLTPEAWAAIKPVDQLRFKAPEAPQQKSNENTLAWFATHDFTMKDVLSNFGNLSSGDTISFLRDAKRQQEAGDKERNSPEYMGEINESLRSSGLGALVDMQGQAPEAKVESATNRTRINNDIKRQYTEASTAKKGALTYEDREKIRNNYLMNNWVYVDQPGGFFSKDKTASVNYSHLDSTNAAQSWVDVGGEKIPLSAIPHDKWVAIERKLTSQGVPATATNIAWWWKQLGK